VDVKKLNWLEILLECSYKMRKETLKLYGSPKAAISFGVGAGGDNSKRIDLAAEKALIDCLSKYEISCTLVSEEAGTKKIGFGYPEYYVVTDPVDGTTNAIRGVPFCANVIAVSKSPFLKDVETAIVHDIIHNVIYSAQKNKGAFRNGEKIKTSKKSEITDAVIGIDFNTINIEKLVNKLKRLLKITNHFRHFGANALEVCYVAEGITDAFIDIRGKLRVTDIVASYLILKEAGGTILSPEGNELDIPLEATQRLSFVAASNMSIYNSIKKIMKPDDIKDPTFEE
jgi:myo-inositol-1(or 4)-monophosphatase